MCQDDEVSQEQADQAGDAADGDEHPPGVDCQHPSQWQADEKRQGKACQGLEDGGIERGFGQLQAIGTIHRQERQRTDDAPETAHAGQDDQLGLSIIEDEHAT